jgi:hypothetical protein
MRSRNDSSTTQRGDTSQPNIRDEAAPTARDVAKESAAIYPDTFATPPTPEEIATEAYLIYCARGCGEGADIDDWLEAERRLSARHTGQRDTGVAR